MHVSSCHQVTDILANKLLGLPLFSKHMFKMWLLNIYSSPSYTNSNQWTYCYFSKCHFEGEGYVKGRIYIYIYIYVYRGGVFSVKYIYIWVQFKIANVVFTPFPYDSWKGFVVMVEIKQVTNFDVDKEIK